MYVGIIRDGNYGPFGNDWPFSTYDNDNDVSTHAYCDQGGWWYYDCAYANLNSRHQPTDIPRTRPLRQRLVWRTTRETNRYDNYTHSEMKIRPISC